MGVLAKVYLRFTELKIWLNRIQVFLFSVAMLMKLNSKQLSFPP